MGPGLPLLPVYLKQGKITSLYLGGERSPILMIFRSTVFCPMIPFLASGAKCLQGVGISLYWHGLLYLLGRTLPGKKCPIWPQEKHFLFVESFPLGLIFFIFIYLLLLLFWPGWGPPERFFSKEYALYIVHESALKAPLFQKKLFIFLSLRQCSGRLWRQSGELLGPEKHKRRWQWSP